MTTFTIPQVTVEEVRKGDRGVVVWAVQRGLNQVSPTGMLSEDGVFGDVTDGIVRDFQVDNGLFKDGRFGAKSSQKLAELVEPKAFPKVPPGLLKGIVYGESTAKIGAVNWSVPGGVDCGYVQKRVDDSDANQEAVVQAAFDPLHQFSLTAKHIQEAYGSLIDNSAVDGNVEFAWRLAALNHNWPFAADIISKLGVKHLPDDWRIPVAWVENIKAKFDDGTPVMTKLEWARFYALGAFNHNHSGLVVKYVTNWNI